MRPGDSDSEAERTKIPGETPEMAPPVSRVTVAGYSGLALLLLGWFCYGLFVQRQGLVDSVGESLGTAFTFLLIVSVIGMIRQR